MNELLIKSIKKDDELSADIRNKCINIIKNADVQYVQLLVRSLTEPDFVMKAILNEKGIKKYKLQCKNY